MAAIDMVIITVTTGGMALAIGPATERVNEIMSTITGMVFVPWTIRITEARSKTDLQWQIVIDRKQSRALDLTMYYLIRMGMSFKETTKGIGTMPTVIVRMAKRALSLPRISDNN